MAASNGGRGATCAAVGWDCGAGWRTGSGGMVSLGGLPTITATFSAVVVGRGSGTAGSTCAAAAACSSRAFALFSRRLLPAGVSRWG